MLKISFGFWSPTAVDVGNIHWTDYYPGDDYVDWGGDVRLFLYRERRSGIPDSGYLQ